MTPQRYSTTAIVLHWLIAVALAFQLVLGWRLAGIAPGAGQFVAYQLHKSVGIAILLLTLLRVGIRFAYPRPDALADDGLSAFAAKATHLLLYAIMLLGPLSGWALVSTSKLQVPTLLFGTIPWPHLPIPHGLNGIAYDVHSLAGYLLAGLIVLHVAGAIRHQFYKRENLLPRMIPGLNPGVAFIVAMGAIALAGVASFALNGKTLVAGPNLPSISTPTPVAAPVPQVTPARPTMTPVTSEPTIAMALQPLSPWLLVGPGKLGFVAHWNGTAVNGSFVRWTSDISYSSDDLPNSAISVTIDLASAVTGDAQRDETLQGADYFDVSVHPQAVFRAKGFRPRGGDRYEARGTLDLHGRRQPVTLRFTLHQDGDTARAQGEANIDRNSFGIGSAADDTIAANVAVRFVIVAKRKDK